MLADFDGLWLTVGSIETNLRPGFAKVSLDDDQTKIRDALTVPEIRLTQLQTSLLLMNLLSSDLSIDHRDNLKNDFKRFKIFDTVNVSPTLCPIF